MIHREDNIIVINTANAHASSSFTGVGRRNRNGKFKRYAKVIERYLS